MRRSKPDQRMKEDWEKLNASFEKFAEEGRRRHREATQFKPGELTPEEEELVKREGLNALNYIPTGTMKNTPDASHTQHGGEGDQVSPRLECVQIERNEGPVLKDHGRKRTDPGDLVKEGDRKLYRWLGVLLLAVPALFKLAGGMVSEEGIKGWIGEWFYVTLAIMACAGLFLLLLGFGKAR